MGLFFKVFNLLQGRDGPVDPEVIYHRLAQNFGTTNRTLQRDAGYYEIVDERVLFELMVSIFQVLYN